MSHRLLARGDLRWLASAVARAPVATWATDRNLRVVHARGGLDFAGARDGFVIGPLPSSAPPDAFVAYHLAALAGKEQAFRISSGRRCFEVRLAPLGAPGQTEGVCGFALDVTERAESERALEKSQRRLADAQRAAHVGSWEWTPPDTVECTDELLSIYGMPADYKATYADIVARFLPDEVTRLTNVVFDAFRTALPFAIEHRITRADGVIRVLVTRGEVLSGNATGPMRVVGSSWDVTERATAVRSLERANAQLAATLEATADALLVVDKNRTITNYNRRFLAMWNLDEASVARRDDRAILARASRAVEDPAAFLARVDAIYEAPDEESSDAVILSDGRIIERSSRPERLGDAIVGRVWSFRDVTDRERRLARTAVLADAGRLLASLEVEKALDAIARVAVASVADVCVMDLWSGQSGPRRVATAARKATHVPIPDIAPAVWAGRTVSALVDDVAYITAPFVVRGRVVGAISLAALARRPVDAEAVETVEELARRVALAIENTDLHTAAKDALDVRADFLSVAAHEIRGPLTAMRLATQTLQRGGDQTRMLELLVREQDRLARFVDELLDVSRIQTGRVRLELAHVDLGEVARDATTRVAAEIAESRSELRMSLAPAVIGTWCRASLEQVVTHILSNAAKFGLGNPIDVTVSKSGSRARLVVDDHGVGIPPEKRAEIFEPFKRAVSSRNYGGLGLGLYIARTLVEGMNGTLRIEGAPELGTSVTVELPAVDD
jgi:signal transduction histidine kinase